MDRVVKIGGGQHAKGPLCSRHAALFDADSRATGESAPPRTVIADISTDRVICGGPANSPTNASGTRPSRCDSALAGLVVQNRTGMTHFLAERIDMDARFDAGRRTFLKRSMAAAVLPALGTLAPGVAHAQAV